VDSNADAHRKTTGAYARLRNHLRHQARRREIHPLPRLSVYLYQDSISDAWPVRPAGPGPLDFCNISI
jgi:hypothetical protein